MNYKHIVFDVDGTLVDSVVKVLSTLRQSIIDMRGDTYTLEELDFAMGMAPEPILTRLGYDDVQPIIRCWEQHLLNYAEAPKLFNGIHEVVLALHNQGKHIGVATSRISQEYETDFRQLELYRCIEAAICADHVEKRKPAPDVLLKYMELMQARPEEILFVGDTEFDMGAAQAANVDFALAGWGSKLDRNCGCKYYLAEPSDILKI